MAVLVVGVFEVDDDLEDVVFEEDVDAETLELGSFDCIPDSDNLLEDELVPVLLLVVDDIDERLAPPIEDLLEVVTELPVPSSNGFT